MKKVLLGTSAIALASAFASTAGAADWDVKVGGYMEQHLTYSSADVKGFVGDDYDGVDVKSDTEIHFKPSITLDNGLKIGAVVELEGNTGGDQIDESYIQITGSFGQVLLGNENSAGYKMSYGAPDVSFYGINSGTQTSNIPFSGQNLNPLSNGATPLDLTTPLGTGTVAVTDGIGETAGLNHGNDVFRGTLGSTFLENGRNNDAARITYFSPRFAGFQVGLSYARDPGDDSSAQVNNRVAAISDIIDVGANYVNSFGGFDVALSGRWGIATDNRTAVPGTDIGEDPQVWGAGINLGFAGVTIGGSFAEQNGAANQDGRSFDAGISYETGPWGFSFTYFNGENVNNENAAALNAAGTASANDEKHQAFLLAGTYALAKGVSLGAYGGYFDFDEETGDAGGPNVTTGDDIDGFVIGTGIKVSF